MPLHNGGMHTSPAPVRTAPLSHLLGSLLLDLVLVIGFTMIGRAQHGEALDATGIVDTAWPFVAGLIVAWLVARAWRAPAQLVWIGLIVWVVTVLVGLALRVATGDGIAPAFIIVATIVLAVFLLGWRLIAAGIRRVRRAR